MNYEESREYILNLQKSGIRLGLDRMRELMHLLGDPQDKLKFIHVAGTNGKGSTCSFICAALSACGYRVGMYTSPAVEDVREQYTINGEWISEEAYANIAARVCAASTGILSELNLRDADVCLSEEALLDMMPTVFEYETAMAFLYFHENNCDYVVLETGLGGREDATNIVKTTVLSVLTSISEDHLGMIGNNLEEIAKTKAGIIKQGVPAVMLNTSDTVRRVIEEECRGLESFLYLVNPDEVKVKIPGNTFDYKDHKGIALTAPGAYQPYNAALALKALEVLKKYETDIRLDDTIMIDAVSHVTIPYRMERISDDPLFYLDGAHNPDAAVRLRETIGSMFPDHKLIFIIGMFGDKDYREVIRIMLPLASHIITVQTPDSSRALPAEELGTCILEELRERPDLSGLSESDVESLSIDEAVKSGISLAKEYKDHGFAPCIIAFGSLSYLKYIKEIIS